MNIEVIANRRLAHIYEDCTLTRSRANNIRQTLEAEHSAADALTESRRHLRAAFLLDIRSFYELAVSGDDR